MIKRYIQSMIPYMLSGALILLVTIVAGITAAPTTVKRAPITSAAQPQRNQISPMDQVSLLRAENAKLRALAKNLSQRLREMQMNKPFCSDVATSSTKAGGTTDCTPYACDYEGGSCLSRAATSNDCAPGFLLDPTTDGKCVPAQ